MRCFILALSILTFASACMADGPTEETRLAVFLKTYNGLRADKRLAALSTLKNCKQQRSHEALYIVSVRDRDPEVRSRAFSILVRCEDAYGYIAYLAADSFKQERDLGVKMEKADQMTSLKYKWSALNELVAFLSTLRWSERNWGWHYGIGVGPTAGYVAGGNPPETPGTANGYDDGGNREPLRWRYQNELIALAAGMINKMAGTKMESRPRIDQEVVKWWSQKSELWAEYDRNLRAKTAVGLEVHFKDIKDVRDDDIKPGTDTLKEKDNRSVLKLYVDPNEAKPAAPPKKIPVTVEDE